MRIRLNNQRNVNSVNTDSFSKIELKSSSNILPVNNISNIVNSAEQFNKERQKSPYYRIIGNIKPMFTNVLFNTTGENSWETFNSVTYRDANFPPDGLLESDIDLTYSESINKHLKVAEGWYGHLELETESGGVCNWVDMEPNREKFNLSSIDKNWELLITYPSDFVLDTDYLDVVHGGIQLISSEVVNINGRNMTLFCTPIKHGLSSGDTIKLKNLNNEPKPNGDYKVYSIGKVDGDNSDYYFIVDTDKPLVISSLSKKYRSRVSRVFNGVTSEYYYRKFTKIKTKNSESFKNDDYEIYPLAFSQTIYEDKINQFIINSDIDVSGLIDNLDRPLSEIYVTLIKTDSNGTFTNVKSGIKIDYNEIIKNDTDIPDINRITDSGTSHECLEDNVTSNKEFFYGDIVEYNKLELKEKVLSEIHHRFNSTKRLIDKPLNDTDFNGKIVDLGVRQEGYIYKPHHRIKIREFSSYIEQGTKDTYNVPTYRVNLGDGRYIWRDLLDIGFNDAHETVLDYPFLNGAHYINKDIDFRLRRQDPFGLYGLKHDNFPSDMTGRMIDDKNKVKITNNGC